MNQSPLKQSVRRFTQVSTLVVAVVGTFVLTGSAASCGGGASCDSLCSNFVNKCVDAEDAAQAKNSCLEQCKEQVDDAPEACATQKDDVLDCLSHADSLDCYNPTASASCKTEYDAFTKCTIDEVSSGGSGSGSGGNGSGSGGPAPSGGSGAGGPAPGGD